MLGPQGRKTNSVMPRERKSSKVRRIRSRVPLVSTTLRKRIADQEVARTEVVQGRQRLCLQAPFDHVKQSAPDGARLRAVKAAQGSVDKQHR